MTDVLVVGGTGKTGRRVVERLRRDGHRGRAAGRSSAEHRFDWSQPGTYAPAVEGAEAAFLTVAGQDPANADRVHRFVQVAAAAGVERVVLLSARAVEFHPDGALAEVESAVRDGAPAHTILRPAWFAQNFTESFLAPDAEGVVTAPTGDGLEPFVDLGDVADVAVAALLGAARDETVALSGGAAISFAAAVELLGRRTSRPLRFVAADPDAYRRALSATLPAEYVAWRMAMFDAIRDGRDAYISDGVCEVLGRPAASFAEWVAGDGGATP